MTVQYDYSSRMSQAESLDLACSQCGAKLRVIANPGEITLKIEPCKCSEEPGRQDMLRSIISEVGDVKRSITILEKSIEEAIR